MPPAQKSPRTASKRRSSTLVCEPNAELDTQAELEDHRVRNGVLRRKRMRHKLLSAAMSVFAEKGLDTPSIDDFITAAGVARGTFYNYFSTTQELLDAVTSELSDSILASIDEVVLTLDDPLERLATGSLLYLHFGVEIPSWGAFVMRTGFRTSSIGKLVDVYLTRDLELAHEAGVLKYPSLRAARDLMFGCIAQAIFTVINGDAPREHLREMLALGLQGIGVTAARARKMSQLPLPCVQLPDFQLEPDGA